jgi:hypothetical protein
MGLFPFNTNWARQAQTDVQGQKTDLYSVVRYDAGTPVALAADGYVTSTNMIVGAYTLAATAPGDGLARNVTVSHTDAGATDTLGTVDVVGTDLNGDALTETLTPVANSTVQGTKAFKTIVSITGVDWVISEGNDQITFGWGDLIGLPDKLAADTVLMAIFNAVREATAPTVTFSSTVLALNTVDLNSALDGSTVTIYYIV